MALLSTGGQDAPAQVVSLQHKVLQPLSHISHARLHVDRARWRLHAGLSAYSASGPAGLLVAGFIGAARCCNTHTHPEMADSGAVSNRFMNKQPTATGCFKHLSILTQRWQTQGQFSRDSWTSSPVAGLTTAARCCNTAAEG